METMLQGADVCRKDFLGATVALGGAALVGGTAFAGIARADEAGDDMAAQFDRVVSELTIRNKVAQYTIACDECDPDAFHAIAWDDSTWIEIFPGSNFEGDLQDFMDFALPLHEDTAVATHHDMMGTYVVIKGDKAVSQTGGLCNIVWPASMAEDQTGHAEWTQDYASRWMNRYIFRWERRDGEWKIAYSYCVGDIGMYYGSDGVDLFFHPDRPVGDDRAEGELYQALAWLDE